jgi:hypothetical protein
VREMAPKRRERWGWWLVGSAGGKFGVLVTGVLAGLWGVFGRSEGAEETNKPKNLRRKGLDGNLIGNNFFCKIM